MDDKVPVWACSVLPSLSFKIDDHFSYYWAKACVPWAVSTMTHLLGMCIDRNKEVSCL